MLIRICFRLRTLRCWLFATCVLASMSAAALEVTFVRQDRVVDPNAYEQGGFGLPTVPMLPPGDVAMIDDYFHNTTLSYQGAAPGDSLGVRATGPTGAIRTNIVTRGTTTNCWFAGLT